MVPTGACPLLSRYNGIFAHNFLHFDVLKNTLFAKKNGRGLFLFRYVVPKNEDKYKGKLNLRIKIVLGG